jgi:hypothetical protein
MKTAIEYLKENIENSNIPEEHYEREISELMDSYADYYHAEKVKSNSVLGDVSEWVSTANPPMVYCFYLVYDQEYGAITKALYDQESWHTVEAFDGNITHYMTLPKPPVR